MLNMAIEYNKNTEHHKQVSTNTCEQHHVNRLQRPMFFNGQNLVKMNQYRALL